MQHCHKSNPMPKTRVPCLVRGTFCRHFTGNCNRKCCGTIWRKLVEEFEGLFCRNAVGKFHWNNLAESIFHWTLWWKSYGGVYRRIVVDKVRLICKNSDLPFQKLASSISAKTSANFNSQDFCWPNLTAKIQPKFLLRFNANI